MVTIKQNNHNRIVLRDIDLWFKLELKPNLPLNNTKKGEYTKN